MKKILATLLVASALAGAGLSALGSSVCLQRVLEPGLCRS